MKDTSAEVEAKVADHYRRLTPEQRMRIASDMFDTAWTIVESSLPAGLSQRERRLAVARRFYGHELPEVALIAFAEWGEKGAGGARGA